MTTADEDLKVSQSDGVLRLTLNREDKRNALSAGVMRGMLDAVRGVATDGGVRVVVIASAGERIFCAGADLAVMAEDSTGLEQHEGRGLLAKLGRGDAGVPGAGRSAGAGPVPRRRDWPRGRM